MTGTVVLHMFMMVLRELEHSLELCNADQNDDLNFGDPSHALDKAVAYFVGSLYGNEVNNSTDPHLLFHVAEELCENFNTCVGDTSRINGDIFFDIRTLQRNYLGEPDCTEAQDIVYGSLVKELYVPLVQGTLLNGFLQRTEVTTARNNRPSKHHAAGSMFAASILPILHACDEQDAAFVLDQMRPTQKQPVDFVRLKEAFERNYECMGISCFDVGGIYIDGDYWPEGEPCHGWAIDDDDDDDDNGVIDIKLSLTALRVIFYSVLAAVSFFCTCACLFGFVRAHLRFRRRADTEKDGVFVDKSLGTDDMFDEEIDFEVRDVTIPTIEIT